MYKFCDLIQLHQSITMKDALGSYLREVNKYIQYKTFTSQTRIQKLPVSYNDDLKFQLNLSSN